MAQYRPQRRPHPSRLDDDELRDDRGPSDPYDDYETYPPQSRGHSRPRSPPQSSRPRRHNSERRRPPPSQPQYADDLYGDPRQTASRQPAPRQRRHKPDRRGRSEGPERRRRDLSPPPVGPDPGQRRHKTKPVRSDRAPSPDNEPYSGRKSRPERHSRKADAYARPPRMTDDYGQDPRMSSTYDRDPRMRDSYGHNYRTAGAAYERDSYGRKPPRDYPDYSDDARERRPKPRGGHGDPPPRHRGATRGSPPEARPRGRAPQYSDSDDDYYGADRRPRPRSQGRDQGRDLRGRPRGGRSPSRGRPPTTQRSKAAPPRRSSMPASTKAKMNWWQNPYVQAGCRTAFTAGAQAAMKSRGDPDPWLGPKGAKVATAALGAALVDGWMGQKHAGSARQNLMRQGIDLASSQVAANGIPHPHSKPRHRR